MIASAGWFTVYIAKTKETSPGLIFRILLTFETQLSGSIFLQLLNTQRSKKLAKFNSITL